MFGIGIGLIAIAALVTAGCAFTRFGYESAAYKVSSKSGEFEIRNYESLVIVSTPMAALKENSGESFMRLFRYISKDNEGSQKISMTTPVLMTMEEGKNRMSFVVPKDIVTKGVPKPKSPEVEIETFPAGRYASYRFSRSWNQNRAKEAEMKLREWAKTQKLKVTGTALLAGYDPPFTPKPMRRNEILLRIVD
ncbi:MAG: heme-binding protein [Akkermansiaceae bacterium]|nr:heme-binding protein [Akkermansiaceae bacterium]